MNYLDLQTGCLKLYLTMMKDHYKEIPFDDNIPEDEQHQLVEASAQGR